MSEQARAQVEMPDGSVMDVPEGTPKEAIKVRWEMANLQSHRDVEQKAAEQARSKRGANYLFDATSPRLEALDAEISKRKDMLSKIAADTGGLWDKAKHYGGLAAGAIGRGLAELPALAAAAGLADDGRGIHRGTPPDEPLRAAASIGQQPQGAGEGIVSSAIQGAAGALTSPALAGGMIRTALTGAASGAGGQVAANQFGDSPIARIAGSLAGGGLASIAGTAKSTRQDLVREMTRDATEQDLRIGQREMYNAEAAGLPINISQAMPSSSNLDEMANTLAQSRHGVETFRVLRGQPASAVLGIERELASLPGQVRQPQVTSNLVQEAASGAIDAAIKRAGKAWEAEAPQGSTIPLQVVKALDMKLGILAAKYPNTTGEGLIQDVRSNLRNLSGAGGTPASTILNEQGQPVVAAVAPPSHLTDAIQLRNALEDSLNTFGARKLNTPSLDAKNLRRAQEVREAFRDVLDTYAPQLSKANAAYSNVFTNEVNPMKQSVVGRLAGRSGFQDNLEAPQGKLFAIFDKGTTPGASTSEILTLEKALRRQSNGAESFQDGVKSWMATRISEATKHKEGRLATSVAADLEHTFLGNAVKAQGFDDILVALARSKGLSDNALLPGMKNMLRYISASARRPDKVGGTTPSQLLESSKNPLLSSIGSFTAIQPIRQPFRALNQALSADAYRFVDKLINSPEGVDTLIKFGKQPLISRAAQNTIATFAATLSTMENPMHDSNKRGLLIDNQYEK